MSKLCNTSSVKNSVTVPTVKSSVYETLQCSGQLPQASPSQCLTWRPQLSCSLPSSTCYSYLRTVSVVELILAMMVEMLMLMLMVVMIKMMMAIKMVMIDVVTPPSYACQRRAPALLHQQKKAQMLSHLIRNVLHIVLTAVRKTTFSQKSPDEIFG